MEKINPVVHGMMRSNSSSPPSPPSFRYITVAKILILIGVVLQGVLTFHKSSQMSFVVVGKQLVEDAFYDTVGSTSAWNQLVFSDIILSGSSNETMPKRSKKRAKTAKRAGSKHTKKAKMSKLDGTTNSTEPILKYLDELPYFFSHIPKSGTEYAAGELLRIMKSTLRLPNNRTIKDVMRAQHRYNQTVYPDDFFAGIKQLDLDKFPVDFTGEKDYYVPPLICNQGTIPVKLLSPYYVPRQHPGRPNHQVRYSCKLIVSEEPWDNRAKNVYTIVRDPYSHTLSQYFHCTESRDHARPRKGKNNTVITDRQDLMPPLDEWLESYENIKTTHKKNSTKLHEEAMKLKRKFHCYDPIDSETKYTKAKIRFLPKNYTYPYPPNNQEVRDQETLEIDQVIFDDLKERFNIIGDMSQMVLSVCAIFIDFTNGKHIPSICDCTHVDDPAPVNRSETFCLQNLYSHPHGDADLSKLCPIRVGYLKDIHNHGVKHSGSSYLKDISDHTRGLIGKLRSKDLILYNVSRAVFDEQIRELEAKHNLKICRDWNKPHEDFEESEGRKKKRMGLLGLRPQGNKTKTAIKPKRPKRDKKKKAATTER